MANAGVVYDVSDAGELLEDQLDGNGNDFTNEVFIFLGGFGVETTLNGKLTLSVEYIAMKHIEYRLKGNEWDEGYVHRMVVNQVGLRYYFYNPLEPLEKQLE